ncbi:MAG: hypothetical protein LBK52_05130, partial [Deltaproteobacteria bacterium]|nr:hypothetical protein [Deltaproteobacteria bacterium]
AASSQNQVVETYQIENGPIMAWVFSDMLPDSFQVTIRQSLDNGTTYQEVGQIWAKKRTYAAEP